MTGSLPDRAIAQLESQLEGRYGIEREVGRGGMATVYLARDLRHDRPVALKVLLPELGAVLGPERFLSEIRVTARLQHPNLLPLFDSGQSGGLLYYTMPFVEGESLRRRLERERQLPVEEAVRLAVQVAEALDYAHRKGIVHRDLKPENILLSDGQALVADFGIALAVSVAGGQRITQSGLSLGTPQYMSPEQAAGDREIDGRSDMYSLAAVLHEMLAGEPPHVGSTVQAVIARVLSEPARSVRATRATVPVHVELALLRALEKVPADRWASAHEFAEALQGRGGAVSLVAPAATVPGMVAGPRRRDRTVVLLGALAAASLLAAAGTTWAWRRAAARPQGGPLYVTVPPAPADRMEREFNISPIAIAPDGRAIVFSGYADQQLALFYRSLGQLETRMLAGTEGGTAPFFSPDGEWVGFFAQGTVKRVPVRGGTVQDVVQTQRLGGGTWTPDGVIVVGSPAGLMAVPASGGAITRLTHVDSAAGETYHAIPQLLPDGRTLVFAIDFGEDGRRAKVALAPLSGGAHRVTDVAGAYPLGVIDGHLVIGRFDGTLAAVPFDLGRARTTGAPLTVAENVIVRPGAGHAAALSTTGSLVYMRGSTLNRVAIVDERGARRRGGIDRPLQYSSPRYSLDGRRIAIAILRATAEDDAVADIWLHDTASGVLSRLTARGRTFRPEWTPDGRRVGYVLRPTETAPGELWWAPADGSGPPERLRLSPDLDLREFAFTPDGRGIVLRPNADEAGGAVPDLWVASLGSRAPGDTTPLQLTRLFATSFSEISPRVSPDGRWLAYLSNETGRYEVYVRPFPGPGGRVQVSSGGGDEPIWSRDGRRLFFRAGSAFVAATLAGGADVPSVVRRDTLFSASFAHERFNPQYDVLPGGDGFVVLAPAVERHDAVVIHGWREELRALVERSRR